MDMTPEQKKKLEKLSHLKTDGEVVILTTVFETKDELENKLNEVTQETSNKLQELSDKIDAIEMPEQKDHTEYMKMMMDKIEEPLEVTVKLNII